ncbi:c-type cytochrome [Candidatus Laterigemmans baculatus]|uniref:c-type cytochrome n=1 Tax=Candidatus Laterigemmans baculatus TaxID=2770505 RepID=UPI00193B3D19|nr:cytochrome c [Candidatus Laterigemmans baculatus]
MDQTTSGERSVSKRSTGKSFGLGVLVGVLVTVIVPLLVLATGVINMGATQEPGPIERSVASLSLNASAALRAPESENPFTGDPAAIETGMMHFRDTCLLCHGAPGIEPEEFARGLNPDPPELSTVLADWSDGELYWLTKHGIRMTGMPAFGPTHSDEDVWRIVAFVRQLSDLTADQRDVLREAVEQGHRHGGARNDASDQSEGHH